MAKASNQNGSDGEGRSPGAQTGLDTRVVQGVNAARLMLVGLRAHLVSERSLSELPGKYGRKTET